MQHTEALKLWKEIEKTRNDFIEADNVLDARKLYKKLKKLQKMYDKCVSDEAHREIINSLELRTRGF